MKVTRIIKNKPFQWDIGVVGFEVELDHRELGLSDPTTLAEAKDITMVVCAESAKLSYAALACEGVISDREASEQIQKIDARVKNVWGRVEARREKRDV